MACWPNGKALDYGSRDCRFESCVGHFFLSDSLDSVLLFLFLSSHSVNLFSLMAFSFFCLVWSRKVQVSCYKKPASLAFDPWSRKTWIKSSFGSRLGLILSIEPVHRYTTCWAALDSMSRWIYMALGESAWHIILPPTEGILGILMHLTAVALLFDPHRTQALSHLHVFYPKPLTL